MKVKLLHSTPLYVASKAIRKCWASEDKSDTDYNGEVICTGQADMAIIDRVGNKNKHSSTLEHLVYNFDIDGPSRALLQEQARHRIASISVQSSRYTLEKVLDGLGTIKECLVMTGDLDIDNLNIEHMTKLSELIKKRGKSLPRDISKYAIVEAYKTSFVWTVNARSLQNFLSLRTDKSALWEIRLLATAIFKALPEEHKYLFTDSVKPI
jgi:thymidylate synthase (FAD)